MQDQKDSFLMEENDEMRPRKEEEQQPQTTANKGPLMERLDRLGFNECMAIVMKYAEKPCVTSVAGHAAHGRILASAMSIGNQLKKVTPLANGMKFDPNGLSKEAYNELMKSFALPQGTQLTNGDIGMIISTGSGGHLIPVFRRINPVVIAYGDKVIDSWEIEKDIDESNRFDYLRPQLMAFLKERFYDPIDGGILRTQYHSVVEGLIHGFLYTKAAVICCYNYKEKLPFLLEILEKEFNFEIKFQSVENVDVVFAHAIVDDAPRYVFILSDETNMALIATLLLVLPMLDTMSGAVHSNSAPMQFQSPVDLPLQKTGSYLFGELRVAKGDEYYSLKLEKIEGYDSNKKALKLAPMPRKCNVLLQLPSSSLAGDDVLRAGNTVNCILFASPV